MGKLDQTLKQHNKVLDKHEDKLDQVQSDIVDIKTRLGIKDITNGNVVKYQEELVKAQEREREERKEQDKFLMERINLIDSRTWAILVGIVILFLGEIVQLLW